MNSLYAQTFVYGKDEKELLEIDVDQGVSKIVAKLDNGSGVFFSSGQDHLAPAYVTPLKEGRRRVDFGKRLEQKWKVGFAGGGPALTLPVDSWHVGDISNPTDYFLAVSMSGYKTSAIVAYDPDEKKWAATDPINSDTVLLVHNADETSYIRYAVMGGDRYFTTIDLYTWVPGQPPLKIAGGKIDHRAAGYNEEIIPRFEGRQNYILLQSKQDTFVAYINVTNAQDLLVSLSLSPDNMLAVKNTKRLDYAVNSYAGLYPLPGGDILFHNGIAGEALKVAVLNPTTLDLHQIGVPVPTETINGNLYLSIVGPLTNRFPIVSIKGGQALPLQLDKFIIQK